MTDPIEAGPVRRYDAIVVGAGFSGLYQLHLLRDRLGLSVRVLEAAGGIGGTWYWNRYPGARCDSESYYYSYSFSRELEDEWDWTERYPDHGEIRRYLDHVADRFDLRRDIQLGTCVAGAAYDEAANRWTVTTESGECFEAQFLITAVGCLSSTNVPEIPGLARFSGAQYHTGRWPHDGVDFSGKRVGLIGTGSTGIQAAPVIAAEAAHLTVFQRTANYSVPARNGPMDDAFRTWVRENSSELRAKARAAPNGHPFDFSDRSALAVSPQERQAIYEAAWERGGLRFRAAFRDIMLDPDANETASAFIRDKIRGLVHDPVVAETLTPRDHLFGTKRPPIDTHYFETFNRSNVKLVDLKATPIAAIVPEGVRTSDATYPLDVIVFATGFDALTGPLLALDIRGRDGVALKDVWAAGPRSYLGLQVPGFPNLFTMTGPGSPSVLTNMPVAIEQHAEWIADCIGHLRERGLDRIEATPDAAESWGTEVNRAASATLLPMASSSWYLGANVPGKPRVFMPYAGGMAHYRGLCERVVADGYSGFALG
ncbi:MULTISPECIES: flavin-containing monooxygenase [Methylobacterium]|uniref:Cyclohexanone monooxygenase n=2 Tax=Methylobacterium TaxID=407 RepID=A0A0C6F8D7_9HYPH|nr:NAD(P)/FAD-dependent oxidoreductase [Methylobacterium aquaticum]BAQ49081.1 cyclohexanone monooxygenase [Methylobacterium aquaticum]